MRQAVAEKVSQARGVDSQSNWFAVNEFSIEGQSMHKQLLILAATLVASSAFTQTQNLYDGNWTVKWTNANGIGRQAHLNLAADSGIYKALPFVQRGKPNQCETIEQPVKVEKASPEELVVAINASKGMIGCPDNKLTLRKVDETTLQGQFAGGTAVTLIRP